MKENHKTLGFILAVVASVMYGLNPLFCIPLYNVGYTPMLVVFYRYLLAVIILAFIIAVKRRSLKVSLNAFLQCFVVGIFFTLSSVALFSSFKMINAGIASVILFLYPIFTALFSALLFHERISRRMSVSIIAAFVGISFLYQPDEGVMNIWGFLLALASGVSYAVYLIWVNRSILKTLPVLTLTFYALLSGTLTIGVYLICFDPSTITTVPSHFADWINIVGLAFFPTIVSVVLVTKAIHLIGSTPASIMGALEPVTALFITTFIFDGTLTVVNIIGILVVFLSVIQIILVER